MAESENIVAETAERIFADLADAQTINADREGNWKAPLWQALSDASRAMYFWPSPGARRNDPPESFAKEVAAGTPPPANFEALVVRPRRVEHLQLGPHPHRRRRWMLAGHWSAASEVNP